MIKMSATDKIQFTLVKLHEKRKLLLYCVYEALRVYLIHDIIICGGISHE